MGRRRGGFFLILFGILLAVVVGGFVFVQAQKATAPPLELAPAVVALLDIPERTLIDAKAVALQQMPKDTLPPTALTKVEDAKDKMTLMKISKGEILLGTRIADTKGESGLSFTLSPTKLDQDIVVMTFPASDIVQTGAIKVGDMVDILVTVDLLTVVGTPVAAPAGQGQAGQLLATQTVVQNLKVLGIGSVAAPDKQGGQQQTGQVGALLTFAVKHQDALILKQLKDNPTAKVEFVLKPAGNTQEYKTDTVTLKAIVDKYNIKPSP